MKIENIELKNILLWLGIFLIISGTMFFFAYNWNEMHKFIKLGLMMGLIFGAVSINLFLKQESSVTDVTVWIATVGIGIELAIFGQIYQTGADAYNLFVVWSIFAFGFVIFSHSSINWFTYLIILNLALSLYISQALHINTQGTIAIKIIFNTLTTILLFFSIKKYRLNHFSWLYKINIIYLMVLTFILLMIEFSDPFSFYIMFSIFYLGLLYHIKEEKNLLIESIAILSLIFLIPMALSSILPDTSARVYFGVLLFIISSVLGLHYLIDKIKTTELSFNYKKLPWMTHIVIFTIVIFSAIGIILVGILSKFITKDSLLFLGMLILVITLLLRHEQKTSLNWYYGFFVAIILSEIGIFGGIIIKEEYNEIFFLGMPLAIFVLMILQIILFVLIKDYLHRVLNIIIFSISILYSNEGALSYLYTIVLILTLTLLIILIHYSKKDFSFIPKSIHDGLIISIIIISYLFISMFSLENLVQQYTIIYQVFSIVLLFFISYQTLQEHKMYSIKNIFMILLTSIATSYIPSLSIILIILILSFKLKYKYLTLLSIITIIFCISSWYYSLNINLLYKSIYMIFAGVLIVLSHYIINKKDKLCEN